MKLLRLAFIATTLSLAASACAPQTTVISSAPVQTGVTVTGSGEAIGVPDMATIQLGVQARAKDAATATAAVNEASQKIVAALRSAGLGEKDMQTRDLSIYEERNIVPLPVPEAGGTTQSETIETSFVARNTLALTVRNLTLLPKVIAAANDAGANEMHGINLGIDDPTPLEAAARSDAFAEAQAKAEQLAQLGGRALGRLIAVEVLDDQGYTPRSYAMAMDQARTEKAMPAVEAGEIKVQQRVLLHFELR